MPASTMSCSRRREDATRDVYQRCAGIKPVLDPACGMLSCAINGGRNAHRLDRIAGRGSPTCLRTGRGGHDATGGRVGHRTDATVQAVDQDGACCAGPAASMAVSRHRPGPKQRGSMVRWMGTGTILFRQGRRSTDGAIQARVVPWPRTVPVRQPVAQAARLRSMDACDGCMQTSAIALPAHFGRHLPSGECVQF